MSIRLTYFLGFIVICLLLITSIYLQLFDGFIPCPLCMLQRFCFAILGILFLFGIFLERFKIARWIINLLASLFSLIGILLASRQIWLQHFPTNTDECGVSLQYMMQVLPLKEVAQKIFIGSAECTQQGWEFFHLNMAEWSLVWFVLFLIFCLYLIFRSLCEN